MRAAGTVMTLLDVPGSGTGRSARILSEHCERSPVRRQTLAP
jgi:hypothetical protein